MSIETAIQEVSEILAYQENDRPEDNTELARMIVEKVERNLTQRAADICTCGHGEDSHFANKPHNCDWCACGAYKRR